MNDQVVVAKAVIGKELRLIAHILGSDVCVVLEGGVAHIGTSVVSVARPSLTGSGEESCTTSVINVVGHKDDYLCKIVSESVSKRFSCVCACVGGFHIDGISAEGIREVEAAVRSATEELIAGLEDVFND